MKDNFAPKRRPGTPLIKPLTLIERLKIGKLLILEANNVSYSLARFVAYRLIEKSGGLEAFIESYPRLQRNDRARLIAEQDENDEDAITVYVDQNGNIGTTQEEEK